MKDDKEIENANANKFIYILPVLFYEYLALSLTKAVIPGMIVTAFGDWSYIAVGIIETLKGIFSFISCPLVGKLSDDIGRRYVLLATVVGTTFPVCILSLYQNMWLFGALTALSGFFTATFTITFAYISDCVNKNERAPAFGLALATFGLSFCIGPLAGGYLNEEFGLHAVLLSSLLLVIINVVYILTTLPETIEDKRDDFKQHRQPFEKLNDAVTRLPNSWNFQETFRVFRADPFMSNIALVIFVYYTAVWALVSTLMLYVTKQLKFPPIYVGWMLSGYGLATMFSEGVLVRVIVPLIGELQSVRLGLLAFSMQCAILAFADSPFDIFFSILFSMLANLVYPSISSLVSKVVPEESQGEAMGALNGIKALTEGFGPLFFGSLMTLFENFPLPGAPYLVASILTLWALLHTFELPPEPDISLVLDLHSAIKTRSEEVKGLLSDDQTEFSDGRTEDLWDPEHDCVHGLTEGCINEFSRGSYDRGACVDAKATTDTGSSSEVLASKSRNTV